jgi:acyl carrier protein
LNGGTILSELNQKLFELIADLIGTETIEIGPDTSFASLEEWDSLLQIQIIAEVEDQFSVSLPFEQLDNLKTVGDIARLIEEAS